MPSLPSLLTLGLASLVVTVTAQTTDTGCTDCDSSVTFINFKTLRTPDGSASAYIEGGKCPITIPDANKKVYVNYQDGTKSTQLYNIVLEAGQQPCTFNGTYYGSTFTCRDKQDKLVELKRTYEDAQYKPLACPPGCAAQCKALDPKWETDALAMFVWRWNSGSIGTSPSASPSAPASTTPPTSTGAPKPSTGNGNCPRQVTSTITVTRSHTQAAHPKSRLS